MKKLGFVLFLCICFIVMGFQQQHAVASEAVPHVTPTSSDVHVTPKTDDDAKQGIAVAESQATTPEVDVQDKEAAVQPATDVSATEATAVVKEQALEKVQAVAKETPVANTAKAEAQPKAASKQQGVKHHKILHTNDIHGRLVEEKDRVIGMAKLKTVKEQENPDLMVDAGDAFQGLPLSNISKGEAMARAMNKVGYDAMVVGNHEFDWGFDQLKKLEGIMNFPLISANVFKDGKQSFKSSVIVEKNGTRYGIVGITTPETKTKTRPEGVVGVEFKDPLTSAKKAMHEIKDKVDIFVILTHLGIDPSTKREWRGDYLADELSKLTAFKQPVMVIDGHSHTVLKDGQKFNNVALAQTGTALNYIGKIDVATYPDGKFNITPTLISVKDVKDVQPDKALEAELEKENKAYLEKTSEVVIPNNTIHFEGASEFVRTQETNLGNLITDAMAAYGKKGFKAPTDFAVTNGGGIRASIEKGKVTLNNIITVLPFGNRITQIQVKGADVVKAMEHSLRADTAKDDKTGKLKLTPNGGFLHVSKELRVYYDLTKKAGERVTAIHVLNQKTNQYEALDPKRVYNVTMNDFTASAGDGYDMFGGPREEGISLDQVVSEYMKHADLKQYAATDAQRIIYGEAPALRPDGSGKGQSSKPGQGQQKKVIPFPNPPQVQPMPAPGVVMPQGTQRTTMATTMMPNPTMKGHNSVQLQAMSSAQRPVQTLPNTGSEAPVAPGLALGMLLSGMGLLYLRRRAS